MKSISIFHFKLSLLELYLHECEYFSPYSLQFSQSSRRSIWMISASFIEYFFKIKKSKNFHEIYYFVEFLLIFFIYLSCSIFFLFDWSKSIIYFFSIEKRNLFFYIYYYLNYNNIIKL